MEDNYEGLFLRHQTLRTNLLGTMDASFMF